MRLGEAVLGLDLYAVLGVDPRADRQALRWAYRKLAMATHPDLNQSDPVLAERRMAEVNVAASVLLDPGLRAQYDRERRWRSRHPRRSRRRPSRPRSRRQWSWSSSGGGDWVEPPRSVRHRARLSRDQIDTLLRFRPRAALELGDFSEWVATWSPRQHMVFVMTCLCLAFALISVSRPTSLFESEKKPKVAIANVAPEHP